MPQDPSLIDFGGMANTAINMGQLSQMGRRNDIYEENSKINAEQNRLEAQRQLTTSSFKAYDEIEKIKNHPTMATNRAVQIDLLHTQGQLLGKALGVDVPLPSKEEMMGGYESVDRLVKTMREGSAEERYAALTDATSSNPVWGKQVLDDLDKAGKLTVQTEDLRNKLQLNAAKLEALNIKNSRLKLQQNLYTEHVSALGRTTGIPKDPQFQEHFQKVMRFEKKEAQAAYLSLHPDFKEKFEKVLLDEKMPLAMQNMVLHDQVQARSAAVKEAQARDGEAPLEMAEELAGYGAVQSARQVQAAWLDDPFNKQKWKDLQRSEQSLRILNGAVGKKVTDIADQRMGLMQAKFDQATQKGLAESTLQEHYINGINGGMDDAQALGKAIQTTKEKYPGVPFDATKIENPNRKGKTEVSIKMGQAEVDRNLKLVDTSQGVIDFANELKDRIKANPAIVGRGGQAGAAFAGAAQQLRSLAQLDPGASKFLNTKTRDESEAFYELLVYMQARSMDPSGPLDLKVVENARKVLGDISSFTTGPQQVLNKLDVTVSNAERNIRRARRNLKGGGSVEPYLSDAPKEGADPAAKPLSEMSEEELMQTIMKGVLP